MAVVAGKGGSVRLAAVIVAEMDDWSMSVGPNLVDSAAFGDDWEEKTSTLRKWSGSFKGRADNTDTNGFVALRTAALNGTTVALRLYDSATTYYSGSAFIEMGPSASVTGLVDVSCTFTGTGALSFT